MPKLRIEVVVSATPEACFDLSLSVDAHVASMGRTRERAVGGVTSGTMRLGDTVTWQATHFGRTLKMTSAITAYERPHRFVDEQQRGPFRNWWDEHTFTDLGGGRTRMVETAEFASRASPTFDRFVLGPYLRRLLTRRARWLRGELEAATTL